MSEEADSPHVKSIPSKEEATQLLRDHYLPGNIIRHCEAVYRKARDIAYNIKDADIDLDLVKAGALLHDIGRSIEHTLAHAALGADLLRDLGYPESLARICEKHIMGGLTDEDAERENIPVRDYIPKTIEEKIVSLADKYVSGTTYVSIDERFQKWIDKYGENEFLRVQIEKVKKMEDDVLRLIHLS